MRQPLGREGRWPALAPEVVVQATANAGAQGQDVVGAGFAPAHKNVAHPKVNEVSIHVASGSIGTAPRASFGAIA